MKKYICLGVLACLLAGCSHDRPQATKYSISQATACPSNTTTLCPTPQDAAITDRLRQAILDDPQMSVNARNIIIHTDHGLISLKGAVNGWDEEKRILEKTSALPGMKGVDDQLDTHAWQSDQHTAQ